MLDKWFSGKLERKEDHFMTVLNDINLLLDEEALVVMLGYSGRLKIAHVLLESIIISNDIEMGILWHN